MRSSSLPRCPGKTGHCGGSYLIDWMDVASREMAAHCMLCGRPYIPARVATAADQPKPQPMDTRVPQGSSGYKPKGLQQRTAWEHAAGAAQIAAWLGRSA